MRRKVVKHGPSTFIISLPAKWVKAHSIQKGETLEVRSRGDSLIVSRDAEGERVLSEDVSVLQPALVREYVRRAYVDGYDRVEVTHNDLRSLDAIQSLLPELPGYVIIQQDDENCTVQSISKELDIDFASALRSATDIVQTMVDDIVRSNKEGSEENLRGLRLQIPSVTKMTNFCRRQLNRKAVPMKYDHGDMHCYVEELTELAVMLEQLGSLLAPDKGHPGLQRVLDLMSEQYRDARRFFESEGRSGANALSDSSTRLRSLISTSEERGLVDRRTLLHCDRICDSIEHMTISHVLSLTDLKEQAPSTDDVVSGEAAA